jgi:hypothetical protein
MCFACGDIAHGARLFIDAIASAQIAARSMHDYLRGTRTEVVVRKQWKPASYAMAEGWNVIAAPESAGARKRIARGLAGNRRSAVSRAGSPPPGVALPALQRQHRLRYVQMRGLQRLRGHLPGESDPPGGAEQAHRKSRHWMERAVEAFGDLSQ